MSELDAFQQVGEAIHLEEMKEEGVDARLAEALKRLEQTSDALGELTKSPEGESPEGFFARIVSIFDHISDAIGDFFKSLFGSSEPTLSEHDAQTRVVAEKLGIEIERLQELKNVRHEFEDMRQRLHAVRDSGVAESLERQGVDLPALQEDAASVQELLDALRNRIEGRMTEEGTDSQTGEAGQSFYREVGDMIHAEEAAEEGVDARIAERLQQLEDVSGELKEALTDRDLSDAEREEKVRDIAQRIGTGIADLKELQGVRHEFEDVRQQLHELRDGVVTAVESGQSVDVEAYHARMESLRGQLESLSQRVAGTFEVVTPPEPPPEEAPPPGLLPPPMPRGEVVIPPEKPVQPEQPPLPEPVPVEQPPEVPESESIVGNPETDEPFIHHQGANDLGETGTCSVVAQEMILDKFAGSSGAYSENQLLHEAIAHGWFSDGTPRSAIGNLLEQHGVRTERVAGIDLGQLAVRLGQGEEAIVSVNAGTLWGNPVYSGDGSGNHAVWVTGVRMSHGEVTGVFVNDSGTGSKYEVGAETFSRAWAASDNYAVFAAR